MQTCSLIVLVANSSDDLMQKVLNINIFCRSVLRGEDLRFSFASLQYSFWGGVLVKLRAYPFVRYLLLGRPHLRVPQVVIN